MSVIDPQPPFVSLDGGLSASYRWTTGPLVGGFLAALRDGPACTGARCASCAYVCCTPADVCPSCGNTDLSLVPVGPAGSVVAHAAVRTHFFGQAFEPPYAFVLVRLDGADGALSHVAPGEEGCELRIGDRVEARFRPKRDGSILDLEGFVRASGSAPPRSALPDVPAIETIDGVLDLPFSYSYGSGFSRFYSELQQGRITAVRCPSCKRTLLPPRPMCGSCFVPVEDTWVPLSDHGAVRTFTIVHMPYDGQPTEPPYAYALIVLDGADGEFHHIVRGLPLEDVHVGMRVQARWRPPSERKGSFYDVECFIPEADQDGSG